MCRLSLELKLAGYRVDHTDQKDNLREVKKHRKSRIVVPTVMLI